MTRYRHFIVIAFFLLLASGLLAANEVTTELELNKPTKRDRNFHDRRNANMDILEAASCSREYITTSQFDVGSVVFHDTTTDRIDLAICTSLVNVECSLGGMVQKTDTTTSATISTCATIGPITDDAGLVLSTGLDYFISSAVAGKTTSVETAGIKTVLVGRAVSTTHIQLASGGGSGGGAIESITTTAPAGHIFVSDGSNRGTAVSTSTIEGADFNSKTDGLPAPEGQTQISDGASGIDWGFAASGRNIIREEAFGPTDPEPIDTTHVTIELSQDGAPSNAIGALIVWGMEVPTGAVGGNVRRDSSDTNYRVVTAGTSAFSAGSTVAWFSPGTQSFQANLTSAQTFNAHFIVVYGYVVEATVSSQVENVFFFKQPVALTVGSSAGNFPDETVIADQVIDLSAAIPVGSAAAQIRVVTTNTATASDLFLTENGVTVLDLDDHICIRNENGADEVNDCWVTVNSDQEAKGHWLNAWTAGGLQASVLGYALRNTDPSQVTYLATTASALTTNDVVFLDTTSGQVSKAQANTTATARVNGVVKKVLSSTLVQVQTIGERGDTFRDDVGAVLVPNTRYYLSENVSGAVTGTLPTTFRVSVGVAKDVSTLIILPDRFLSIDDMSDVNMITTTPLAGQRMEFDGVNWIPTNKTITFEATDYNSVSGDYAVNSIAANGQGNFSFKIPDDFHALVSLELIVIPTSTNATADIDLFTDYALDGEDPATNSEADVATTYAYTVSVFTKIDLAPVFSSLLAGHNAGLTVDHNAIGGAAGYHSIEMVYR